MASLADLARKAKDGKPAATKKRGRGKKRAKRVAPAPLKQLRRVHRDFVTAYLAQKFADPGGAWLRVSTDPGMSHSEAQAHAIWLLDQQPIQDEVEAQLVPLLLDEHFDRRWVAQQLYRISEGNIFDYLRVESSRELLMNDAGEIALDEDGAPAYRTVPRVMLLEEFGDLPVWKQRNLKKLKIRRGRDGDIVELEIFDRHKAINDIARYSGMDREDNSEATGKVFAEEMRKAAARQERMARAHQQRMLEEQGSG